MLEEEATEEEGSAEGLREVALEAPREKGVAPEALLPLLMELILKQELIHWVAIPKAKREESGDCSQIGRSRGAGSGARSAECRMAVDTNRRPRIDRAVARSFDCSGLASLDVW